MIKDIITAIQLVLKAESKDLSRLSAYLIGPLFVAAWTIAKLSGGIFSMDAERPFSVSELRTELLVDGPPTKKAGTVVIMEPVASEYRIPLQTLPSGAWTSLAHKELVANRSRIRLDEGGLSASTPLVGVAGPVTVVLDAQIEQTIEIPGSKKDIGNFLLESKSGLLFMWYVVAACAFSFGLSLATGFASVDHNKNARRKKRAKPRQH